MIKVPFSGLLRLLPRMFFGGTSNHMSKAIVFIAVSIFFAAASAVCAWDGFDASTTELVAISPPVIPSTGAIIEVRDYETDTKATCVVHSVTRNSRTVEVTVYTPNEEERTLVMTLP